MKKKKKSLLPLKLGKLYKIIFPFTAVRAELSKKYGYSFAAFTEEEEGAKIPLDAAFMVEENEIVMVVEVTSPPTRDRTALAGYWWGTDTEYTFLNQEGHTIQTLDPGVDMEPFTYLDPIKL